MQTLPSAGWEEPRLLAGIPYMYVYPMLSTTLHNGSIPHTTFLCATRGPKMRHRLVSTYRCPNKRFQHTASASFHAIAHTIAKWNCQPGCLRCAAAGPTQPTCSEHWPAQGITAWHMQARTIMCQGVCHTLCATAQLSAAVCNTPLLTGTCSNCRDRRDTQPRADNTNGSTDNTNTNKVEYGYKHTQVKRRTHAIRAACAHNFVISPTSRAPWRSWNAA